MKNIRKNKNLFMPVAILSAGVSSRMKTYEPRSLLKINDRSLIEYQYDLLSEIFDEIELILVVGYKSEKVLKKINDLRIRIVENQWFEETSAGESLRLAIQNNVHNRILFMHGDLVFNTDTLNSLNYNRSFIIVDNKAMINDREVGVVVSENKATNLSYGIKLKTRWCQIAYIQGEEYQILKHIFLKNKSNIKNRVSFEIINQIIDLGGNFHCYEPENMKILEIDSIKDIKNVKDFDSQ